MYNNLYIASMNYLVAVSKRVRTMIQSNDVSRLIKLGIYGFCSGKEMARRGWCHLPKQCGAMIFFFCSVAHWPLPHILSPVFMYQSNVPPSLALLNLMLPLFSFQFSVAAYGTWNLFFFLAFCNFWASWVVDFLFNYSQA